MTSYLLFRVEALHYAVPLERVKRIVNVPMITPAVGKDVTCEGIMNYEGSVIEVYSFRSMIGKKSYVETVETMFDELKGQHKAWIDALSDSVTNGVAFTKTTDPHACHLGKWIDKFSTNDDSVNDTKRFLNRHHQELHKSAVGVLETYETDPAKARSWVENEVQAIYMKTIGFLQQMASHSEQVANDSQRLLIMSRVDAEPFGLKVDDIDDIVHVEESAVIRSSGLAREGRYIKVIGAMEHNKRLLSVIESITIPKGKA